MSVNISLFAGAGAQFFDNNGVLLTGGLLYTYSAGTTTPSATYTSITGSIANSNPIVLDSSGRVPNEIWLTSGSTYKFILQNANGVQIGSWDNIPGINDFTSLYIQLASSNGSSLIGYNQGGISAITTTVQAKLRQTVSVMDFGAKGDGTTDDSSAIQSALTYGMTIGATIVFPTATYAVKTLVNVVMSNNQSLTIDGQNSTIVESSTSYEQIIIGNANVNNGCNVTVNNLNIVGSGSVSATHWGVATSAYAKNVALELNCSNINVNRLLITDIWGKGLNISYFTNVNILNFTALRVGGHSYTYSADSYGNDDSFGDAIYFNLICNSAIVNIQNYYAEGLLNPAGNVGAGNGLSRGGIIFENQSTGANNITVNVNNFICSNYERTFHFESTAPSSLNLTDAIVKNTSLLTYTYNQTLSSSYNNVYYNANVNGNYLNAFFLQQLTATATDCTFINPTKSWDGNVSHVPSGTNITFNNCIFYFNNGRFESSNCTIVTNNCLINDYSADASNTTMLVKYNNTKFTTTISATYGLVLSANSGTSETYYCCDFTNQTPSVSQTLSLNTYQTDIGSAGIGCIRVNNTTTDIPKIYNAIYKIYSVDTGILRMGYVDSTGAIYTPGTATNPLQAGSVSTSVRLTSVVTFSAWVEISQSN
jgi:hypothetical protein